MLVGAKVCDLTEDLLWFVCGLYVGILTSSLINMINNKMKSSINNIIALRYVIPKTCCGMRTRLENSSRS